jgi:hypothetical protein
VFGPTLEEAFMFGFNFTTEELEFSGSQFPYLVDGDRMLDMTSFFVTTDCYGTWLNDRLVDLFMSDVKKYLVHRPNSMHSTITGNYTDTSLISLALDPKINKYDTWQAEMFQSILSAPLRTFPTPYSQPNLLRAALTLKNLSIIDKTLARYQEGCQEHNACLENDVHIPRWRLSVLDVKPDEDLTQCVIDLLDCYPQKAMKFIKSFGFLRLQGVNDEYYNLQVRLPEHGMIVAPVEYLSNDLGIIKRLRISSGTEGDSDSDKVASDEQQEEDDKEAPILLPEYEDSSANVSVVDAYCIGLYKAAGVMKNGDTLLAALCRTEV